ncbi:DUF6908 domain-containing protein [Pedobacter sp. GSP4]|uniref:DUF6908 domain-containing protein n=1 Tax=Pedobacter sp. GSP4 TaxID=3453716 RepID=UPI003EE9E7E2
MKTLDLNNTKIFCQLIEKMKGAAHLKIANEPYMALSIERLAEGVGIAKYNNGYVYSLAHYYALNGDLMSDPEMTFIVVTGEAGIASPETVKVIPCSFTQSDMGVYEESVRFSSETATDYDADMQTDHTEFANVWLGNINDQGFLEQ